MVMRRSHYTKCGWSGNGLFSKSESRLLLLLTLLSLVPLSLIYYATTNLSRQLTKVAEGLRAVNHITKSDQRLPRCHLGLTPEQDLNALATFSYSEHGAGMATQTTPGSSNAIWPRRSY